MIYTYLSSKDRETGTGGIISFCGDVSIMFILEYDICDLGFLPPITLIPALGQDAGTWLFPTGSSTTWLWQIGTT